MMRIATVVPFGCYHLPHTQTCLPTDGAVGSYLHQADYQWQQFTVSMTSLVSLPTFEYVQLGTKSNSNLACGARLLTTTPTAAATTTTIATVTATTTAMVLRRQFLKRRQPPPVCAISVSFVMLG